MKNVLIFIHYNTYFENLSGIARALKESHLYNCQVIFPETYGSLTQHLKILTEYGISAMDYRGQKLDIANVVEAKKIKEPTTMTGRPSTLFKSMLKECQRLFRFITKSRKRILELEKIIARENADLVILGGCIVGTETAFVVKAAHQLKIHAIAFVNWLGHFEGLTMYSANPEHRVGGVFGKVVSLFFKKWIHQVNGKSITRLPASHALAIELLGLSPPNPWVLHSGDLDGIGVEGDSMKKQAGAMSLSLDKIHATGSVFHDEIFVILKNKQELRSNLYRKLGFDSDRPMLLVAIPPDFLYPINGVPQCPQCDFQNYKEMVTFWSDTVAKVRNYNVVICLHPATPIIEMAFLEERGLKIATEKTSHLIPLADTYVACVSSTIGIAISCGVPVINYDVYRLNYSDFTGFSGVILVQEQTDFQKLVERMDVEETYRNQFREKQSAQARDYALIDGQATHRILEMVRAHSS